MQKTLQYSLPLTLTLFMCVSIERTVVTDGGYDRLFGLPLPYITNNFGCSGCYEVYVQSMIVNLLFLYAIVYGLIKLLEYMRSRDRVWFCTGADIAHHWVP